MSRALALWRPLTPAAKLLAVLALVYSLLHFGRSAVWLPLVHHGMVQAGQEMRPVQRYILRGRPVGPDNYRQYGPTFLFIMHGFLTCCSGPDPGHLDLATVHPTPDVVRLSRSLYVLEMICFVAALWFVLAGIRFWLEQVPRERLSRAAPYAGAAVVLIWLNYTPFYEIIDVKTVEAWEVCLLSAAMYAHLRQKDFWVGFCVAAATLMKWLPGFFFLLLLLRNRRAFVYGCLCLVAFLGISHAVYGPELGFKYPLLPLKAASGNTIESTGIANMSLKGLFVKGFGRLQTPQGGLFEGGDPRSGYYVNVSPGRANLSNLLGNLCTVGITLWFVRAMFDRRRRARSVDNDLWEWALTGAVMFVVSPLLAYEYSVLVLPAFSIAAAMVIAIRPDRKRMVATAIFALALFLVGNMVPRQLVQTIIPTAAVIRWSGYTHLKLTEAYYYFGFPMLGVMLLVIMLWWVRPEPWDAPAMSRPT